MNEKILNLNKTVYELSNMDSEIPEILAGLGFTEITKPNMISTIGRFMTIPKGAAAKKIDLEAIKQMFISRGYKIEE